MRVAAGSIRGWGNRGKRLGALLLSSLALEAGCQKPAAPMTPPPPVVGVVESRLMTVPLQTTATGTSRALQEVMVRARVGGFLTERHFEEGAFVKKGQLLLVIEEDQYKVALLSAQAKLADAEARLQAAKESKKTQIAEATLAVSKAKLSRATIDEERGRRLSARGALSAEELDRQVTDLEAAKADVMAQDANRLQAEVDVRSAIALAEAAMESARADVKNAELNLGYCRMFAPIDGRIGELKVKVGNLVGPTATAGVDTTNLASIQQLDPMGVDVRVSSSFLDRWAQLIPKGLKTKLTRPGIRGEAPKSYEGEVNFYDNVVEPTTSTFLVKVRVPNPEGTLLPGEYLTLDTVLGQLQNAVVVPQEAVTETQAGSVVYVLDKDSKVAIQKVTATITYAGMRVIAEGLETGREVIVEGLQLARPGALVKPEPAHLPAPVTPAPADSKAPPAPADSKAPAAPADSKAPAAPADPKPKAGNPAPPPAAAKDRAS